MTLTELLSNAKHAVVLTGAGISTLSGIPDFRGAGGLYTRTDIDANKLFDLDYFMKDQRYYYEHSKDFLYNLDEKEPNIVHKTLARLEQKGIIHAVITQNIDGLHQKAGSRNVLELHGSVLRNYCERCHKFYDAQYMLNSEGIPRCSCGGMIKPDVVLYEEGLDSDILNRAVRAIAEADVLIIGGTSLAVYPAAGLIDYYRGHKLILVNRTPTPRDAEADLVVQGSIGEIFAQLS